MKSKVIVAILFVVALAFFALNAAATPDTITFTSPATGSNFTGTQTYTISGTVSPTATQAENVFVKVNQQGSNVVLDAQELALANNVSFSYTTNVGGNPSWTPGVYVITALDTSGAMATTTFTYDMNSTTTTTTSSTTTSTTTSSSTAVSSTTSVNCSPSSVAVGSDSICAATVAGSSPTGTITWTQGVPLSGTQGSAVFSSSTCTLSSGICTVEATGTTAGSMTIQASYSGDTNNLASSGITTLAVTTPSLAATPTQGPTGAPSIISGSGYSFSSTYNYCYETNPSASVCSSSHQFTTGASGSIPSGISLITSGSANGLVVVSDPVSDAVIASTAFTVTTPSITFIPSSEIAGSSVTVTGTGFSPNTPIGTFTYAGSTPTTQTCTSQTTTPTGEFSCTFTVPPSSGANTVVASGSDVSSVPADSATATFTVPVASTTTSSTSSTTTTTSTSTTSNTTAVSTSSASVTTTTSSTSGSTSIAPSVFLEIGVFAVVAAALFVAGRLKSNRATTNLPF